jgi:hypothetical protein
MIPIFDKIIEVNTHVYRNIIGLYADFDEFDDLTLDADTKKYAHRVSALSEKLNYHYQAIDYIFEKSLWLPTRFGTGQYPVWYASMDLITSFYETMYHWRRAFLIAPNFRLVPDIVKTVSSVYTVKCHAALIDLRDKAKEYPALIHPDPENYDTTQKWGVRMHKEGYPGLLTLSARKLDGENVAIFKNTILSNAKHFHDYIYEYDMKNKQETIKSNVTHEIILTR